MDMQNVSNLTIPEGEVKAIHDSNNQLLWGRVNYDTKYAGDTYQQTYSGKNLFNYQGVVNMALSGSTFLSGSSYRGYYIKVTAGQTYAISRLNTTGNNRFQICFSINEPANGVTFYGKNGEAGGLVNYNYDLTGTVTVPSGMEYLFVYLSNSNQTITEDLHIQIELNSTATPYEKYVGGTASPNPEFPQDIQVVTGEQTVTVSDGNASQTYTIDLTGKNLFDKNNPNTIKGYFNSSLPQITSLNYDASVYIPCQTNTTYTVQRYENGLRDVTVGYTTEVPQIGTTVYGITAHSGGQVTITTGNNAKYLVARIYHNSQDTLTLDEILATVQIEKNSQPTPYAPYYNYELCKIGNYQDYIYKSGDDWYVHKETGMIAPNGTENWVKTALTNVSSFYLDGTEAKKRYLDEVNVMSTHFIQRNADVAGAIYLSANTAGRIVCTCDKTEFPDKPTWLSWLSTANMKAYFALATSTDTQITDTTLISQLDAIHEWMTRYGYNATVSGNLPMIIDKTNL